MNTVDGVSPVRGARTREGRADDGDAITLGDRLAEDAVLFEYSQGLVDSVTADWTVGRVV